MVAMSYTWNLKKCRDPGSNRGPSDLQSDALPTELSRLCHQCMLYLCYDFNRQSYVKEITATETSA